MRRGSRAERIGVILDADRRDTSERTQALRLQAMAWRQIALIALDRPDYAREKARWLFFESVPFVNGPALEGFIKEHHPMALECGTKAGVFREASRDAKGKK